MIKFKRTHPLARTISYTFDAANRLIETTRAGTTLQPSYDGLGNRVGQTVGLSTTTFALDVQGLPEVISTSAGNVYLHLPGVTVAEDAIGEVRYLLSDGLGSVRQAVDESGAVVVYNEFDPYGNPILNSSFLISNYGYTGEWWEAEVGLLYLRARWYAPETGTFLSRDPVESEPPYLYVKGNPVNLADPSGFSGGSPLKKPVNKEKDEDCPEPDPSRCKTEIFGTRVERLELLRRGHLFIVHTDEFGQERTFQGIRHNLNPPDNMAMAYYKYREHDITVPPEKSPWELLYVNSHEGFDPSLVTRNNNSNLATESGLF